MNRVERSWKRRVASCLVIFILSFAVLGLRAVQLQLRPDPRVVNKERQFDRRMVVRTPRGTIYDSKGRALAVSLDVPSVFADPSVIENGKEFSKKVAPLLKMSPRTIRKKIKNRERQFVWLKRGVNPRIGKKLRRLQLPGLHIAKESNRFYPDKESAAQVLGFVGIDGVGLEGLERSYDKILKGPRVVLHAKKDAKGRAIFSQTQTMEHVESGADLTLTLDSTIQHLVENELKHAARTSGSKKAMAIVANPSDGRIYAMASYPPVNPNQIRRNALSFWRNRPVQEVFEPGSLFKVFTMGAALEQGVISPEKIILCKKGSLKFGRKSIRTHDEHTWLTPRGILKHSDNIGSSRIALELGRRRFFEEIERAGFSQSTGIDLSGEVAGLLRPASEWKDIDLANISFGQGIGVTGVQMIAALSAVANGGFSVQPYVASHATLPDGRNVPIHHAGRKQRVYGQETAKLLTHWMEAVVEEGGSGVAAAIPGYRVAGKTGTSQKIDPKTGSYSRELVTSSFFGFAPAEDPQLVALFVFDEPKDSDFGGQLAAPVFSRVVKGALNYLGVTPSKDEKQEELELRLMVHALPDHEKRSQAKADVLLGKNQAPDLLGLTIREALRKAEENGFDLKVSGSGRAIDQKPDPGKTFGKQRTVKVRFGPTKESV